MAAAPASTNSRGGSFSQGGGVSREKTSVIPLNREIYIYTPTGHLYLSPHRGWPRRNFAKTFGTEKTRRKCDDTLRHFDTIPERDRQKDRQTNGRKELTLPVSMTLSELEWLGEIFNDTKRRAVSLRQLSFFFFFLSVTKCRYSNRIYRWKSIFDWMLAKK